MFHDSTVAPRSLWIPWWIATVVGARSSFCWWNLASVAWSGLRSPGHIFQRHISAICKLYQSFAFFFPVSSQSTAFCHFTTRPCHRRSFCLWLNLATYTIPEVWICHQSVWCRIPTPWKPGWRWVRSSEKFSIVLWKVQDGSGSFGTEQAAKSGLHEAFSVRRKAAVSGAALRDWLAEAGVWNLLLGRTRHRTEDL
jgi:hypothetical protein